ncbi:hypothetical protein [Methylomonas koyamae]|uniref:hypothetical protein n=1 Tax=Methylomonas koyamae TaxID=702114 RepID=UPI000BC323A5|nr:hypothetical protein [Methylomonas koyamae]ATG91487.1 hypothetical protein MKLM6_3297 [Methylomonas koyamae]
MNALIVRKLSLSLALAAALAAGSAQAALLTQASVSVLNSGGAGGSGASTTDMVFASYGSDGWGWAGGAGGVQGNAAVTNTGGASAPANEALKFNLGTTVDGLNAAYGAGHWTVDNIKLSFASSYNVQNNSRFGRGSGSFDIYWVGNDGWAQSKGTPTDKQLNPIYAADAATLAAWSGSQSLLASESFSLSGSGYVNLSYALPLDTLLVNDILTASAAGSNKATSLYLMGTSATLGMIIFTGGQGQALPTLSFDVVTAVPLPAASWLFAGGLFGLGRISHRKGLPR